MKYFRVILVMILVTMILVACAPGDVPPGTADQPFSDAALVIIGAVIIGPLAQVVKVYRERGGKKPSSAVVNYSIFGLGIVLVIVFNGFGFFQSFAWPVVVWDDPAAAVNVLLVWIGDLVVVAGGFLGTCVVAYHILKALVFKRIPWLMTVKMIKAAKPGARKGG